MYPKLLNFKRIRTHFFQVFDKDGHYIHVFFRIPDFDIFKSDPFRLHYHLLKLVTQIIASFLHQLVSPDIMTMIVFTPANENTIYTDRQCIGQQRIVDITRTRNLEKHNVRWNLHSVIRRFLGSLVSIVFA